MGGLAGLQGYSVWVGFFNVFLEGLVGWGDLNGFGHLKRCERLEDWYLVDSKFVIGDKK